MADPSSAPAPSDAAVLEGINDFLNFLQSAEWRRYKLEGFVVITALLLSSMLILRSLRHRTGWSFTKFCLRAGAYLSIHALSYVFGLLGDTPDLLSGLVAVWAVFLIVLATITYNSGSETLNENEAARKRFLWDKVILSLWFFLLLLFNLRTLQFLYALVALWLLNLLKLGERKLALISACRSRFGLDRVTMVVAEFMKRESLPCDLGTTNPSTMKGYEYLVGVDQTLDQVFSHGPPDHDKPLDLTKIATLESIWQSEGSMVSEEGDPDGHLKDNCLSFALFWLLLRRYADYELYELSTEESREKSWKFVRYGLIKEQPDGEEWERAFRVVEVELQFLYDYFYNNYFAIYSRGVRFLVIRVVVLAIYLFVAFYTLLHLHKLERHLNTSYDKHNTQITVTQWIIVMITLVEFTHIIDLITSKWNKVKLVCLYVQERWWETRWGRFKEAYLRILCRAPCFNPFIFSSWQKKLHQYSFLDSYAYTPMILKFRRFLEGYFELPLIGQKEMKPVKVSKEVMKAVIQSLQTNGLRLTNGVSSLRRNNVERLSWACKSNERTTHVILIWHIATSMCQIDSSRASPKLINAADFGDYYQVATSLSKYCAYLVVMAPKLLPDHVYVTQWVFEKVAREAREQLKHFHSNQSKLEKLMSLSEESEHASTLEEGAVLGQQLIKGIEDASQRWKVLAEFWAEMILYLAPSEDVASHAQYLVTGGEFITHLWALLTHAGIVRRDGCVDDRNL